MVSSVGPGRDLVVVVVDATLVVEVVVVPNGVFGLRSASKVAASYDAVGRQPDLGLERLHRFRSLLVELAVDGNDVTSVTQKLLEFGDRLAAESPSWRTVGAGCSTVSLRGLLRVRDHRRRRRPRVHRQAPATTPLRL